MAGATGGAASGAASGGVSSGATIAAGASSTVAKGTAAVGVKVMAAVLITAAVATAGVALFIKQPPTVVAVAPTTTTVMGDELGEIVKRLKGEIAQGFGDGVCVLTETNNPKPGSPTAVLLDLYAQEGQSQLEFKYTNKIMMRIPPDQLPKGWPTPDLDEVLRFADEVQTPDVFATDGTTTWFAKNVDGMRNLLSFPVAQGTPPGNDALRYFWPPLDELVAASGKDPSGKEWSQSVELVHRSDNKDLVGLRISLKSSLPGIIQSVTKTYWLDPNRNDIPVGQDTWEDLVDSRIDGKRSYSQKTEYLEYAQLPNGSWYPTHWHTIHGQPEVNRQNDSYIDYYLIFGAGRSLDAKWFGDPSAHFNANTNVVGQPTSERATAAQGVVGTTVKNVANSGWKWWPWALAVVVLGTAAILAILQRRQQSPPPPLRGSSGPRRR